MRNRLGARLLCAVVVVAGTSLAVAPRAGASGPSIRPLTATRHGVGFHVHRSLSGESDVNVCSDTVAHGFAHCLARVRMDGLTPNVGNGGGYDPSYLQSAYNAPSSTRGSGRTVAVVDAYDSPTAEADLAYYRTQWGLPACTTANGCFAKVDQNGGTTYPAYDSGWAGEIALDVDMVSAICPNCHIILVEAADNSMNNLLTAEAEAVELGADVVSNSWGGGEWSSEALADSAFNHPGVTITASSGDSGYGVEWPAAAPNVISVGGTTLDQLSNTGTRNATETAWSGAGSGCSAYESKPAWQSDACGTRTVADVAAVADPNTPVYVRLEGAWYGFGGTSAASPIVASMFALADTPPAAPGAYLYAHRDSLNDVTSGSNGSCATTYQCNGAVGYDGPTGLGTPNGLAAFGGTGGSGASAAWTTTAPTISGSATEGRTLTGGPGTWTSATTPTYGYQWQRCTAGTCSDVNGATAATYVVGAADVGHRLRLKVRATNGSGFTDALSAPTATVVKGAPLNVVAPAVTGTAHTGSTLTTSNGTWRGTATLAVSAYQWLRCNSGGTGCVPIAGATHKTYVVVAADKGHRLQSRVTVKNPIGTATATSPATAVAT